MDDELAVAVDQDGPRSTMVDHGARGRRLASGLDVLLNLCGFGCGVSFVAEPSLVGAVVAVGLATLGAVAHHVAEDTT